MALLNQELYEALMSANADEEKAKKAAAVLGGLKSDFRLLKWMVAVNTAGTLILIKLVLDVLKLLAKLGVSP